MIYEGEFSEDKREGKGKQYWNNKLIFEGDYLNDKRNGKGKEFYENGEVEYEDEYLNGERKIPN